ncbi:MAG: respiratory nitrate reductase subunit gamma [Deltaproteobacteria bacterium]|nr:respiratory nitrate reductase subunit gamma [Deltaproteobacteria bacterium]
MNSPDSFGAIYNFVSGPLVWVAFIVFVGGSIYRFYDLIKLVNRKEKFIYSYMSWKYSLRSIIAWVTPFFPVNMRKHPVLTVVTYVFHLCLLITPVFVLGHGVLIKNAWNVRWWALPESIADFMTLMVIIGCIFFLVRRLVFREVKYVTTMSDYFLLAIVAAPFVTGFLCYHQVGNYDLLLILHILAGEIMLMAIPFTRLSHMLFAALTRAYIGSEFGKVRHARDW